MFEKIKRDKGVEVAAGADRRVGDTTLHLLVFTLLAFLGAALYSNTLQVPWYFDDFPSIVDQPTIRNLDLAFQNLLAGRGLATLTFALNYHFGGIDTTGYHLVNILTHIITSGLVFLILKRVWKDTLLLPFFGALIFLIHPLQTQAVTYIVQRMTSLSGLFFLLAIYLFLHANTILQGGSRLMSARHVCFYGLSLLCGALAVMIKQNAAVLPAALFLIEFFFPTVPRKSCWKLGVYLLPFVIVPLWIGLSQLVLPVLGGGAHQAITGTQSLVGSGPITPMYYLVTEFTVFWIYIKLLFWPVGQALDYSYPIVKRLLSWPNFLAFGGLLGLIALAVTLYRRRPLISFGIAWFFLTLSVESTIIPLDPVFEHRLYIPMLGFVVVLIDLLANRLSRKVLIISLTVLSLSLAACTWQRNALWNDPVAFYEDNLDKAPWSERVNSALARTYIESGRYDDALVVLKRGLKINPYNVKLNDNLGTLYDLTGSPKQAIEALGQAIKYDPGYYRSYLNLGVVYAGQKEWVAAIEQYEKAINLKFEYDKAHYNLGVAYYMQGRLQESLQEFKIASDLVPENALALYNLASVSIELGRVDSARVILPRLAQLDAGLFRELQKEIAASSKKR